MEKNNLLEKMQKVKAPIGFEQRVMAELSMRRRRRSRLNTLRYSFAGAISVLLIAAVIIPLLRPPSGPGDMSRPEGSARLDFLNGRQGSVIPVMERMDYSNEIQGSRQQTPFVYILEQVSDQSDTRIIY